MRYDRYRVVVTVLVGVSAVAAGWLADLNLGGLFARESGQSIGDLLSELGSPDTSVDYLRRVATLALESLLIGALGMVLALVFGIGFAVFATRIPDLSDAPPGHGRRGGVIVRRSSRAVLALARAIPEIVWAFLFVRIFGLGPGPAVFALGITFGGVIGRVYAELIESVDPTIARQLRAAGAGRIAVFCYGVLPQVKAQWIGYALFRFECAIRSASILGVVGAGGLGQEIDLSIRYFEFDKLATTLIAIFAYVGLLELTSRQLRRMRVVVSVVVLVLLSLMGLIMLEIPWSALFDSASASQVRAFVAGFADPRVDSAFLFQMAELSLVTLSMAWCATIVSAGVAAILAPTAAIPFTIGSYLEDGPSRSMWRFAALAYLVVPVRLVLQVARALPELVWAMIFVLWAGPGPTAGILALTVHTIGILGRLYSDAFEEAEPQSPRRLEAAGVGRLGRYLYGVLPQSAPRMMSFTLLRFEVNVRSAAMVGFVGAGGLGDAIHTAISLFHWQDLATLLATLLALVVATDWLGDIVRYRFLIKRARG